MTRPHNSKTDILVTMGQYAIADQRSGLETLSTFALGACIGLVIVSPRTENAVILAAHLHHENLMISNVLVPILLADMGAEEHDPNIRAYIVHSEFAPYTDMDRLDAALQKIGIKTEKLLTPNEPYGFTAHLADLSISPELAFDRKTLSAESLSALSASMHAGVTSFLTKVADHRQKGPPGITEAPSNLPHGSNGDPRPQ